MPPKKNHSFIIFILGCLTALGPFSIDMYLPAFSEIAKDLQTDVARVALSLSSFFVGISVGQLIYGPLLDRFGRRKPLYIGLLLYILASAGCLFVHSIDHLIALRFLQALGSCAAAVASVAMVRDFFPVKDSAKVFALLMLVVGASPMIAPTVGGYITVAFGWKTIFFILLLLGASVMAAAAFGLPDGAAPDHLISLKPHRIVKNYFVVFKNIQFRTYALTGAIAFSGLFSYVAGSPVVFMNLYHVERTTYGWIFAFLSISFIGSNQINSLLLRRFGSENIAFTAIIAQMVMSLGFLVAALTHPLSLTALIVFLFLFLACVGLTSPNTAALSLAPFTKNAGSASALMGALQMGVGALASMLLGFFDITSTLPMIALMAGTSVFALGTLYFGRKNIASPVEAADAATVGAVH